MSLLADKLLSPDSRDALTGALESLVAARVAALRGASGSLIRAAYRSVLAIRPDFVRAAIARLLPDFVAAMQPLYAEYRRAPGAQFSEFLLARRAAATDELLAVTDRRAARIGNRALAAIYRRLRPRAATQVSAALPELAALLARFIHEPHTPSLGS